ncbi:hypothetical protein NVP1170O_124 [Vibrio phage 1.170.O._10N.261.52.C3]|nr:hypothetical protein NVP1170O_124 [Vibrio phage 1.170.O._10N.261.52.C3]
MSYTKGFDKGYDKGFLDAYKMVLGKVGYSIEFAGNLRKKQFTMIQQELSGEVKSLEKPTLLVGM